jgi:hypothetical protein
VLIFLLLLVTDLHLFVPRYLSSALPGQALLFGGLIASFRSATVRRAVLVALAAVVILSQGRLSAPSHGQEDWRQVMRFLKRDASNSPVVLVGGFVEATDFAALRDPKLRDVLFAPEMIYGEPKQSIRVPITINQRDLEELDQVGKRLRESKEFFLVTENPDRSHEMWIRGQLGAPCQAEPVPGAFGTIVVTRFVCAWSK